MNTFRTYSGYLGSLLLVVLASLVCTAVRPYLAPTNMVMVFLLAVVLAAVRLGLRPAILTAVLSVAAFDIFFVPPRFSLRVADTEYLITFFGLFVVGVVISTLVARLREQVAQVKKQEARTGSLYYLTRDLAVAMDEASVVAALRRAVCGSVQAAPAILLQRDGVVTQLPSDGPPLELSEADQGLITWVLQSGRYAGRATAAFPASRLTCFPIKSSGVVVGVMAIAAEEAALHENRQLLEAFVAQAAMAFERIQLAQQAEEARILREKNQLEQALLNSISHDLRTPLVTIAGVLDTLATDDQALAPLKRSELIVTAAEETRRLNRFVGKLLNMTRLEAGVLSLHPAPCEAEELIGCALEAVTPRSSQHRIVTALEPDLPPVCIDLALLTQALVNLLDNALKHAPPDSEIGLSACCRGAQVVFGVSDCGPGVPPGEEQRIFEKFYRIEVPEKTSGTGLGLSIAKGIVEAHRGTLQAVNRPGGGLLVELLLPAAAEEGETHA